MKSILTKCKICGCEVVTSHPEDCPDKWLKQLVPMIACNRCSDYRQEIRDTGIFIYRLCRPLAIAKATNTRVEPDKWRETQELLKKATFRYAKAIAAHYKSATVIWSQDFADVLMDDAEKIWGHLKFYRQTAIAEYRKVIEPTPQFPT